jgi:SNF2 family DNA or RNA helicase
MIVENSIEEKIIKLQQKKAALAESIHGEKTGINSLFNQQDIQNLLS